jgi:hypothetical protein
MRVAVGAASLTAVAGLLAVTTAVTGRGGSDTGSDHVNVNGGVPAETVDPDQDQRDQLWPDRQRSHEPAAAMTADHSALSRLGLVDKLTSRRSAHDDHDDTAYGHIGIAFTPTGETLGRYLVLYRSQRRPRTT